MYDSIYTDVKAESIASYFLLRNHIRIIRVQEFVHLISKANSEDRIFAWIADTENPAVKYACYEPLEQILEVLNNGGALVIDENKKHDQYNIVRSD